ncbi:MAG: hypothetical protein HN366_05645 [Deltaproteobacteria bacterium]|jgi:hypothetical protein|nr:hypothetical protein [Deltaproteobacteria bacterium]
MAEKTPTPSDYKSALEAIKKRVRSAQYDALKAVNPELITLYWDIGDIIVIRQKSAAWGRSVVVQVAADLQQEFPGISGFSASNLWRMRGFYKTYVEDEKLAPMVREIGWTYNLIILDK